MLRINYFFSCVGTCPSFSLWEVLAVAYSLRTQPTAVAFKFLKFLCTVRGACGDLLKAGQLWSVSVWGRRGRRRGRGKRGRGTISISHWISVAHVLPSLLQVAVQFDESINCQNQTDVMHIVSTLTIGAYLVDNLNSYLGPGDACDDEWPHRYICDPQLKDLLSEYLGSWFADKST